MDSQTTPTEFASVFSFSPGDLAKTMLDRSHQKPACVAFLLSFGAMSSLMEYLEAEEQLALQRVCVWLYKYGIGRVQTKYRLAKGPLALFWDYKGRSCLKSKLLAIYKDGKTADLYPEGLCRSYGPCTTIQVISGCLLFQLREKSKMCRVLSVKSRALRFTVMDVASASVERDQPCLACDGERYVWVLSGWHLKSVSRYDCLTDVWKEDLPELNVARKGASACYVEGTIYVFCGMDDRQNRLSSIEKLSVAGSSSAKSSKEAGWNTINVALSALNRCFLPAVVPLSAHKIVILSGSDHEDVSLFDTETELCVKIARSTGFGFSAAWGNQTVRLGEEEDSNVRVLSLVNGMGSIYPLTLIEWNASDATVVTKKQNFSTRNL